MEEQYKEFLLTECDVDTSHGLSHIQRVVSTAKILCSEEGADLQIVNPAAWLHDCVILPKNHPDRASASKQAAEKASGFLKARSYPQEKIHGVVHAIEAHSYSAGINPETIEAKIVQDADRLDALGAIGIVRCFTVGGRLDRPIYHPEDPFCDNRTPNDAVYTVDHFYKKLFTLPETMNTESARVEARTRVKYMQAFLDRLRIEIS